MSGPALALIGVGGQVEQSTETFRRRYEDQAELRQSPQVESVLLGESDRAVVNLDGVDAEIEAVTDAAGMRHALLTLPGEESAPVATDGNALLTESFEDSPAIVWLKNLDGRYLRVNPRYTALLGTAADRLVGKTDAEFAPRETVDGPRRQERGDAPEPLQLEYTVAPFEGRPPLAALRFAVRDRAGEPIAVCGVAAPLDEASVARDEASRLIDIERWSALDAGSVRAEVLTEWGVVAGAQAPTTSGPAAPRSLTDLNLPIAPAVAPLAPDREQELVSALEAERTRAQALERSLAQAQQQLSDRPVDDANAATAPAELERAREEVAQARAQAEQALADAEAARGEAEAARREAAEALLHAERLEGNATEWREQAEHAEVDGHGLRARLEQAEAEVKQSRTRLEQAEADAQQSRARLEQTEAGAEQSRARMQQAEAEAATLRTRLQQAEAEAATLRTRLQQAEAAAQQIRSRVESTEADARRAEADALGLRTRLEHAEADAQQSRARLEEAEVAAQKSRTRLEQTESEARTLRARVEEAERDARGLRARAEQAETAAQQSRTRMEEAEADARAQRARLEEAEADSRSLKAHLEEAEGGSRTLRARLEDAETDARGLRTRLEEAEADHRSLRALLEEAETASRQARTRLEEAELSARESRRRAEQAEADAAGRGGADSGRVEAEAALRATLAQRDAEAELALKNALAEVAEAEAALKAAESERTETDQALKAALAERDALLANNAELMRDLEAQRQEIAALGDASASAAARAAELAGAIRSERARTDELMQAVVPEVERAPASDTSDAASPLGPSGAADLPAAPIAARPGPAPAADPTAPGWTTEAQRALVALLGATAEWRSGVEEAIKLLGGEGGWDVVRAWVPDEPGTLRCSAMWTALGGLSASDTLVQQEPRTGPGSLLAQAIHAPSVTWLADIDATNDERISAGTAHGMSSAVLLPVRDGATGIGLLELMTRTRIDPDPRMALSLEAAALQLGRFAGQLRHRS